MGWTTQGYNAGFNPTLNIKSDYWYVENSGDSDDEVEKYSDRKPDIGHWNTKVKIVYGLSGHEYFRGYVLTQDIEATKRMLRAFQGFLCYEHKYGGIKRFNISDLKVFSFLDLILFYEMNPAGIGGPISDDTIVRDLLSDLEFGIGHHFIDDCGKTLDEIKESLKHRIMNESI